MANQVISKIGVLENKLNNLEEIFQIETDKMVIKIQELEGKLHRAIVRGDKNNIDKKYRQAIEDTYLENKKNGRPGKIRVGRVAGMYEKGRKYPITYGYRNVSVVSLNKTSVGSECSPFVLRDDKGRLHENVWQFSKIYENVLSQKQKCGWCWGADRHVDRDNVAELTLMKDRSGVEVNKSILEEYWKWRKTGMDYENPVRYPVGFSQRHNCLGCVWPYDDDYEQIDNPYYPMKIIGYVESRKKIYSWLYIKLVKETDDFKKLKDMVTEGFNIQILDLDGPRPTVNDEGVYSPPYDEMNTTGIYGEDGVGSIEVNEKNIKLLLNDTEHPFGHGFSLAVALLGKEEWILDS